MVKFFSFIFFFFASLLMNLLWSIPAWVLLALHFWLGISIWWFIGGLAFWIFCTACSIALAKWANRCSSEKDPDQENKNPYSKKL